MEMFSFEAENLNGNPDQPDLGFVCISDQHGDMGFMLGNELKRHTAALHKSHTRTHLHHCHCEDHDGRLEHMGAELQPLQLPS